MLLKRIIETKYESNWGEWGAGVQNLSPTLIVFAFWFDLWCGDSLLKEEFPEIFLISRDLNSSIAGLL